MTGFELMLFSAANKLSMCVCVCECMSYGLFFFFIVFEIETTVKKSGTDVKQQNQHRRITKKNCYQIVANEMYCVEIVFKLEAFLDLFYFCCHLFM